MGFCTVKIICTTEEFPLLVESLINVPMIESPKEQTPAAPVKKKQMKYFCPVPDCKRTHAVYLYQHLRSKHKMSIDEVKKWTKIAKTK